MQEMILKESNMTRAKEEHHSYLTTAIASSKADNNA